MMNRPFSMGRYVVYLRCGKPIEIEADEVKCVDFKNQTYKFYKKADADALNSHVVGTANNPDFIYHPKITINDETNRISE